MKDYSIGEVAKLANISVRTLRHYDAIDLLRPNSRAHSGYRYYTEDDINRLYDILFYRALGFSLKRVADVLSLDKNKRMTLLKHQQQELDKHIQRLQTMKSQLDITIETEVTNMTTKGKFDALDGFDPDQYEAETKEKWGETDAYKISAKRTKKYTEEDWARYKQESNALNQEIVAVMTRGLAADSNEAIAVVEQMRLQIDKWFYPCSRQAHAQLGEMYVMDERFTKTYEDIHPGLAEYMKAATVANFEQNLEG